MPLFFFLLISFLLSFPFMSVAAEPFGHIYFPDEEAELTPSERQAMQYVREWKADGKTATKPVRGANGDVQFVFGASMPSILCAVLQVTDVQLEAGEQVNSLHFGDSARWSIEPAITGSGAREIQHLVIKPRDMGLETSLIVTTNRRTYHIKLRSTRNDYMPKVSFIYSDSVLAKWEAMKERKDSQVKVNTTADGEYLGNLDFNYEVFGDASWKPLRVFNDGVKTIIQMPRAMREEAPTLLVVRKNGGMFASDETVMVNYRLQGDRYIVDTLFEKAILIAGVGKNQDKITIARIHR